jgi:NUMOD4 motif
MTREAWLPVVGYEGLYEVSDRHRVRSLRRVVARSNGSPYRVEPRVLRPYMTGVTKVPTVSLMRPGQRRRACVSVLNREAFGRLPTRGAAGNPSKPARKRK